MVTHISKSPEETRRLGVELAAQAKPGWVVGLVGDLGAGKTQFVKGLAEGLGVAERIHSPTFTLLNEYRTGRCPLYHLDLYRLESIEQIRGAGLDDYFPPQDGVAVVEWFDRLGTDFRIPALCLVAIKIRDETEREITYENTRA